MKKILRWFTLLLLSLLLTAAWLILGPAASGNGKRFLYIPTGHADRQTVEDSIARNGLLKHPRLFSALAGITGVWEKLKPGRYELAPDMGMLGLLR
jgi:UPF0755 protein